MGYWHYGYGPFEGILHVLFIVLILMIIVRLVRGKGMRADWYHTMGGKDALDILKERYAKGEINKEEFEQKKADLMK